jgi:peptidoglycan/LPS O-acetylase OafA/YrhL
MPLWRRTFFTLPSIPRSIGFLLPTWSLTVEESFYLAFASVLLAAASIFGRRAVWPVIALFLTAPIAFRIAHYGEVDTYFAALGWLCPWILNSWTQPWRPDRGWKESVAPAAAAWSASWSARDLHVAVLAQHGVDQVSVPVDRPIR